MPSYVADEVEERLWGNLAHQWEVSSTLGSDRPTIQEFRLASRVSSIATYLPRYTIIQSPSQCESLMFGSTTTKYLVWDYAVFNLSFSA